MDTEREKERDRQTEREREREQLQFFFFGEQFVISHHAITHAHKKLLFVQGYLF